MEASSSAAAQRPAGITILAILSGLYGLLAVGGAACTLAGGALLGSLLGSQQAGGGPQLAALGTAVGALVIVGGLILLVSGGFSLAFAFGAWTLKPWGWILGLISQGISILSGLMGLMNRSDNGVVSLISVLLACGIIYYLFDPGVRQAFRRI